MKNRILLYCIVLVQFIFQACSSTDEKTIIIQSESNLNITILGFDNFKSFEIARLELKAGEDYTLNTAYKGLALIKKDNGRQYPLVINNDPNTINIAFNKERGSAITSNSNENDFLYSCLVDQKQMNYRLRQLDEQINSPDASTVIFDSLKLEYEDLLLSKEALEEKVYKSEFEIANTVLQARLLNESTYQTKSPDDLESKKDDYQKFIKENYQILKNSDMLSELSKQFFMMHEYVSFYDPKSKDMSAARDLSRAAIIDGVDFWINVLETNVPKNEVVENMAGIYYNRSMVSQAGRIFDSLIDNDKVFDSKFKVKDTFPDFTFDYTGIEDSLMQASELKGIKILALVNNDHIYSKTDCILLGRDLDDIKINIPIIVLPIGGSSEGIFMINKMLQKQLLFLNDDEFSLQYLTNDITSPQYLVLDGENKILRKYWNRRDLIDGL